MPLKSSFRAPGALEDLKRTVEENHKIVRENNRILYVTLGISLAVLGFLIGVFLRYVAK